jgi:hypothetical protein
MEFFVNQGFGFLPQNQIQMYQVWLVPAPFS